jgi:hypothetical protein
VRDALAKLVHALGTRTAVPEWVDAIGRGSLLIVDEAGMAATLDLAAVVDFAGERGASVRLWRPDLGEFGKLHVRHGKAAEAAAPSRGWCRRSTARTG